MLSPIVDLTNQAPRFSLLYRYFMLYSSHSYVRLDKVSFNGGPFSAGLRASRNIAAGQFLLTTCSSMCIDEATQSHSKLSVIQPSATHLGPKGPRLLLGPFRFANHNCNPNAQVWCPSLVVDA